MTRLYLADGLRQLLDHPESIARHNGIGYDKFLQFIENEKPIAKIMRDMNIGSFNTVKDWLAQLEIDKKKARHE